MQILSSTDSPIVFFPSSQQLSTHTAGNENTHQEHQQSNPSRSTSNENQSLIIARGCLICGMELISGFNIMNNKMKSTKVQTLGRNIGTFGLETPICMHMYYIDIYRTSFQHNLHCFIDACVHVVDDYIVSN